MNENLYDQWLSDDPLPTLDDVGMFGRGAVVDHVMRILLAVRTQSESSAVSLIGAWGSGKTSVLNELSRRLRSIAIPEEEWLVAVFNPWQYAEPSALYTGFFAELRNALPKGDRWSDTRSKIAALGRRMSPLASFTQLAGFGSKDLVDGVLAELETSATAQKEAAEKALRDFRKPILVIVDDLDRLSADELLHVFKLVRLVGRLPNVYYMLSYDEQTIVDLLRKTDLVPANDARRAMDYLEKMVQVRVDMPLLRDYEVDAVVGEALERVVSSHGGSSELRWG